MKGFSEALANHGAWEHEVASQKIRWSPAMYRIHGVTAAEFEPTPASVTELIHPDDRATYREILDEAIADKNPFAYQHRIKRLDGTERIVLVRGGYIDEDDHPPRLVGTTQDVTGKPGEEEHLWHLANHDSLSGLFNRRRFMEELRREVAFAKRSAEPGAVLMIDLDRFKDINDTLGHMAGDALLTRVARHLRGRLRTTDTLARLGGDEFAIVLPGCPVDQARHIATELLRTLNEEAAVQIAGTERRITASIGVASFGPGSESTADGLLVEADLAMYRAKNRGRAGVEVFDEEMRAELAARMSLEGELREALTGQELRVQYQPIVALADGGTVGCEALVRWDHPLRGMVPPNDFLPVAEETGLISEIGTFMLDRACRQAAEWRRVGRHLYVSVNVSPRQVMVSDLVREVAIALEQSGLPAPLLCLEITETSLLTDSSPLVSGLRELKRLGVRIAIDDFGGGASSLGLLRLLPIDQIKIDRMFIERIAEQSDDRAIVAAVLSMAHELGMSVVAEGIETEHQQGRLRDLGCQYGQGFLYAKAQYPEELSLDGYSAVAQPGVGDPSVIREFMRQIGIPASGFGASRRR